MSKSYFGYAERQADSFVNWAEIGKNVTDMLREESKIREDKKAAIDKATREFGETLANAPQGEHKSANEWALQYGSDATEAMLMQERLLKSGRLRPREYTIMRQNLLDGTNQAFKLAKEYQEEYKTKMERYRENKSQDLEVWLAAQAEGFGDFSKSQLYINPTNFQVSVAMKERKVVDGKEVFVMNQNPNEFTSVNALRNRVKGKFDRFDVQSAVKSVVDSFGDEINSIERLGTLYKTGSITETLDITKRKNLPKDAQGIIMKFEEAETKILETQLANEYNTSSILTNTIKTAPNGKQYTYTYSKEERDKNPNLILLKDTNGGLPVPEFTEEQYNAALERLRLDARMQYDKKETMRPTPQAQLQERRPLSEGERDDKRERDLANNFARNLVDLLTGNKQQKDQAAAYFASQQDILGVTPTSMGISIEDPGGAIAFEYTKDGKTANPIELGSSMLRMLNRKDETGKATIREDYIMDAFNRMIGGRPLTTFDVGRKGREIPSYAEEVKQYTSKNVKESFVRNEPQQTADNLNEAFGALGFVFTPKEEGLFGQKDFIMVKTPNSRAATEVPIDDNTSSTIESIIISSTSDDRAAQSGIFPKKEILPGGGTPPPAKKGTAADPEKKKRIQGY